MTARSTRATWSRTPPVLSMSLVLALAGCGGGGDGGSDGDPPSSAAAETTSPAAAGASAQDDASEAAEAAASLAAATSTEEVDDLVDDMVEDLEDQQAAVGGGAATLQVGDEEWSFENVLCAFGEEQIGQEGAEVVVSSIQDGLQFYVSIDSFGHSVSLHDVQNFDDPSVALSSTDSTDFIQVDGKDLSGSTTVMDDGDGTTSEASFEVSCP